MSAIHYKDITKKTPPSRAGLEDRRGPIRSCFRTRRRVNSSLPKVLSHKRKAGRAGLSCHLHPLRDKFCIRKWLLSRLRPMRPLVMRGVGRVPAYRACSFRGVVDRLARSRLARSFHLSQLRKFIVEAEDVEFLDPFLGFSKCLGLCCFDQFRLFLV